MRTAPCGETSCAGSSSAMVRAVSACFVRPTDLCLLWISSYNLCAQIRFLLAIELLVTSDANDRSGSCSGKFLKGEQS